MKRKPIVQIFMHIDTGTLYLFTPNGRTLKFTTWSEKFNGWLTVTFYKCGMEMPNEYFELIGEL